MVTTFRHDAAGTDEQIWAAELAARQLPPLDLAGIDRLVVVAAHPDDETLGLGGLVSTAHRAGLGVHVVCATAGDASHPASPTHTPQLLADRRIGELRSAMRRLAPDASLTVLGLPDGGLADHQDDVASTLVEVVGRDGATTMLLAPWRGDRHPDHEAAGRAAAAAASRTDSALVEYPIWLWHWGSTADVPWTRLRRVTLDATARAAKAHAIREHVTQIAPLSDQPGDEALLGPEVLAHFDRPDEVVIVAGAEPKQVADDVFERLHRRHTDPWGVEHRWYERRKRAVTMAMLPRERYRYAVEVGCSIGALAADLAARCDRLLALDSSPVAVDSARRRLDGLAHVDVRQGVVPQDWPTGRPDLVVVSEVGYFLSPEQLDAVTDRIRESLADDGHLVLCHWRPPPRGWLMAGDEVHERVIDAGGLPVLAEYRDRDVLLHVLGAST